MNKFEKIWRWWVGLSQKLRIIADCEGAMAVGGVTWANQVGLKITRKEV